MALILNDDKDRSAHILYQIVIYNLTSLHLGGCTSTVLPQLFLLCVPSFRVREKRSEFLQASKTLTVIKTHFNKQSFPSSKILGKQH